MSKPPAAAGGNNTHNPLGQRQPSEKRMCHRRATGGVFEKATGGSLPVGNGSKSDLPVKASNCGKRRRIQRAHRPLEPNGQRIEIATEKLGILASFAPA